MPKKAATKANAAKQEADTGVAAPPKAGGGVMKKGKHEGDVAAKKKEKDLNSPKKPMAGAYGVYLAANREAIKKTLPADHKITDVAKAAGTRWAAVSDTEKMPYQMQYEANVVAYKKAMEEADAAFKAGGGVMEKKRKRLEEEAAKMKEPKRPVGGAYGIYLAANREAIRKALPADHKNTAFAKAAGTKWAAVSDTEKMPYQRQYDANVAAYKKAMEEKVAASPAKKAKTESPKAAPKAKGKVKGKAKLAKN
jgi:hypothetical protein